MMQAGNSQPCYKTGPCKGRRLSIFLATRVLIMAIVINCLTVPALSGWQESTLPPGIQGGPPFPQRPMSGAALSRGKFLIASRNIKDPRFEETVILIIDHDSNGTTGLIINRPTDIKLSEVLPGMEGLKRRADTLSIGGPVDGRQVFLLLRSARKPDGSLHVFEDVYVTNSRAVLQRMVEKGERLRLFAGYAGWASLQLEREVSRGDWHVLQADAATIFEKDPSAIWPDLIRKTTMVWI
jgi:putative transcriptional regulator